MISQSTHLCLLYRFLLPVEIRFIIINFLCCKLSNETIRCAVQECCYFEYSTTFPRRLQRKVHAKRKKGRMKYGNIEWWDTSRVTDMSNLFYQNPFFNTDITNWDVSNVTDMNKMFTDASVFNQPIGKWNVSKVETMYWIFDNCLAFNQSLKSWELDSLKHEIVFVGIPRRPIK